MSQFSLSFLRSGDCRSLLTALVLGQKFWMPRLASAAQHKGAKGKGSGKATPPASTPTNQGPSKAAKRAATIAAKKARDREVDTQDDASDESSEVDKESGDKDAGDEDGTESSSSAGSDISEDTKAELVKLVADRRAAKKRKLSLTSTDVVGKGTSSKTKKRKALSSPEQSSGDESDDLVEVPAVPVGTMRIRKAVDRLSNWLARSALTQLPTPVPAFGPGPAHASLVLVYTASLLEMRGKINRRERPTYMTYLSVLEVVRRYLPQLLSHKPAALPVANLYVCDTMAKIKGELDEAILTLNGQQELIDCTFTTFLIDLRSSGDAFRPAEAVIKSMASLSTSVTSKKTKTAINTACSGDQGFSPALLQQHWQQPQQQQGYHQQQLQLQHGGEQQTQQQWSDEFGMLCREPELLDGRTLQWACVKCGAGASYGARGHNAADCEASDAQIEAWVHYGQAAP